MSNEKPVALKLAEFSTNWGNRMKTGPNGIDHTIAAELRRLHARVQELEGMLEAVGAGGVSAQRVTQAKDHIAQDRKMVAAQVVLPEPVAVIENGSLKWKIPIGEYSIDVELIRGLHNLYTEQQVRELLATAPKVAAQPWIDPNDKTQTQFLPHIGEQVLFKIGGRVYTGKHTGGSFKADYPLGRLFNTWRCLWMYPSALDGLSKAAIQPQDVDQAPVAWRYQTPTGWHATTDAAAANRVSAHHPIEPLYASPQPQADARAADLVAAVVYASTEAMKSSMESPSFDGTIILESHHAASLSLALDELEQHRAAITKATGRVDSGDGS